MHRDLKLANVKVRADGSVKVLDFGLAKALDQGSGIKGHGSRDFTDSPTLTTPFDAAQGRPAMTQAGGSVVVTDLERLESRDLAASTPGQRNVIFWSRDAQFVGYNDVDGKLWLVPASWRNTAARMRHT